MTILSTFEALFVLILGKFVDKRTSCVVILAQILLQLGELGCTDSKTRILTPQEINPHQAGFWQFGTISTEFEKLCTWQIQNG